MTKSLPRTVALTLAVGAALLTTPSGDTKDFDLTDASIADINEAIEAGALTSEKLVSLYLKRIEQYDPTINAVITLNPNALQEAKALDAERQDSGARSPLHGIPVVLKDNFDTADLPTSGGFHGLKDSLPPQDATIVAKLKKAGAIILAKVNMSEFASGGASSSHGGRTLNPHDFTRTPSGSSGGTGAALAAVFAPLGYGTDTGGSVRGPSTSNGIFGLKPTHGLLSRAGIIPLALSFDTGGPMARSVYDLAASLNVTVGIDSRDDATKKSEGKTQADYTEFLDENALAGKRIGYARTFRGMDGEVDSLIDSALTTLKAEGATVVDIEIPQIVLEMRSELYNAIRRPEFKAQIADYLATLPGNGPKTLQDLVDISDDYTAPVPGGPYPNPARLALMRLELKSHDLSDPAYIAARDYGMTFVRETLNALFETNDLDAIVYPTNPRRPARIDIDPAPRDPHSVGTPTNLANLSGFPDLIVPAGYTSTGLPIGMSFFGPAWSEPTLIAFAYDFEQATKALRVPASTPPLPDEAISY